MSIKVIILCAGKGTRMKSEKAKVMHEIMGKPMIEYIYDISSSVSHNKILFVVGHKKEQIMSYFQEKVDYVEQKEQLGTGHAIMLTKDEINEEDDVLIMCGDTPLIKKETIQAIIDGKKNSDALIVTSIVENPNGYGRIIKDKDGNFEKIVEDKDTNYEQKKVKEINAGMYLLSGKLIKRYIDDLSNDNSQKEYYLTDLFAILKKNNHSIATIAIDEKEIMGVNSRVQLEEARKHIQERINKAHMENGVSLINPDTIYIEANVVIGKDTVIYPNNIITGNTVIGENCILSMENEISNSVIKDGVHIRKSFIEDSYVDEHTKIGPYAHLRPKTKLGKNVKIGNFVEVKNAILGDDTKASHLSYVGDADVGDNVNIGCGVVFVNYDGKNKYRSTVKNNSFIGSNSNLIAPVTIGEKGYVATGSTVTDSVPEESLCIARARQVIKAGWTKKKGLLD